MAYTTTTTFNAGLTARVSEFFGSIATGFANRRLYQKTFNELNALSDRELQDLGLSRSGLSSIAREAVYGA